MGASAGPNRPVALNGPRSDVASASVSSPESARRRPSAKSRAHGTVFDAHVIERDPVGIVGAREGQAEAAPAASTSVSRGRLSVVSTTWSSPRMRAVSEISASTSSIVPCGRPLAGSPIATRANLKIASAGV